MSDRELMAQVCACVDAYRAEQAGDCDIELGPEYALEQVRLLVAENSSRAGCASGAKVTKRGTSDCLLQGALASLTPAPPISPEPYASVPLIADAREVGSGVAPSRRDNRSTYSPGDSPGDHELLTSGRCCICGQSSDSIDEADRCSYCWGKPMADSTPGDSPEKESK